MTAVGEQGGGAWGASGEDDKIRLDAQRELDKMQVDTCSGRHAACITSAALAIAVNLHYMPASYSHSS